MITFQVPRELPPSQQPSHSQSPHPLRPSSAPSFGSFGFSAPSISEQYQPPSHMWSYVPPPSLWSSQSVELQMGQYMTSSPSNIHVSRCFLLLYKRSSSCNSAPPQPPQVHCLGLCCPGTEGPARPNVPSDYCCGDTVFDCYYHVRLSPSAIINDHLIK